MTEPIKSQRIVFVTGATGVVGRKVLPLLRQSGHTVRAASRSAMNLSWLRANGAAAVEVNLFDAMALQKATAGCTDILHLATSIPPSNLMKKAEAWSTNDRLRRVSTKLLAEAASANAITTLLYPSVCRVYPSCGSEWIDAGTTAIAAAPPIQSTLDAEAAVSSFAKIGRGIGLRMGQFYGTEPEHTQQELNMARWGLAATPGDEASYRSLIWIDDAARAVATSLDSAITGTYDIVDDEPLTNREATLILASAVGRKRLWHLPKGIVNWAIGSELAALMGRSQRVSNRAFRLATGWSPTVPSIRQGYPICAERRS